MYITYKLIKIIKIYYKFNIYVIKKVFYIIWKYIIFKINKIYIKKEEEML